MSSRPTRPIRLASHPVSLAALLAFSALWATLLVASVPARAQAPAADADPATLRVAVKVAPPFVIETADHRFEGIAVELWQEIAGRESFAYEYASVTLEELLAGVREGRYDVGIGAITVTAARERTLDFSHPFHASGLGIATRPGQAAWMAVLSGLLSWDFLRVVAGLSVLLLAVGILVWWFERRSNPEQFDSHAGRGLAAGFWFAAVTMTTVGYGDKAPRSVGGRVVSLIWMFTAIIVISFFTAGLASSLTVNSLSAAVAGPEDLPGARVATVPGTTSANYLEGRAIDYVARSSPSELILALENGEVDAVVYDAPILQWLLKSRGGEDLIVLPGIFEEQEYAFAMASGDPRRETINRRLLEERESPGFRRLLEEYLGR